MLQLLIASALAMPSQVTGARRHDVSADLRTLPRLAARIPPEHAEPEEMQTFSLSRFGFDPLLQTTAFGGAPAPLFSFEGIGPATNTVNANPPDANGAVGRHHFVQMTNFWFAIFNKEGSLLYGPAATSTPWQGFSGSCSRTDNGDPVVLYDRLADRWVLMHMAWDTTTASGVQCVAVSVGPDPTEAWYLYEFAFSSTNDAGKIGLWPDAYVYTTLLTTNDGRGRACAFDRMRMLSGGDATQQCFVLPVNEPQPVPADLDGPRLPTAGAPAWLVTPAYQGTLGIFRLHVDWTQPSSSWLSARTAVEVAHWDAANCAECVSQPGTIQRLIDAAGHLENRIAYRNFGDHEALVMNHPVDTCNGILGIRWYELRPEASGNVAVFQQGTFGPDSTHRWMGSAAMDKNGNLAVGYSASSDKVYPSIRYAARLAGDPPGLLTLGEATLYEGHASQTWSARWGDYSSLQIDPVDDCTFWYTAQYAAAGSAGTRISSFRLPGCGATNDFAVSVTPTFHAVQAGSAVTYDVRTQITSGTAEWVQLSVSGLPARTSGLFNPTRIRSGTAATLVVSAAAAAVAVPPTTFTIEATTGSTSRGAIAQVQVVGGPAPDA